MSKYRKTIIIVLQYLDITYCPYSNLKYLIFFLYLFVKFFLQAHDH